MADHAPPGWPTVTPRIFTADPEGLTQFVAAVFGASGDYRPERPAEMRIGDSIVMIRGDAERDAMAACLYVYVEDADATFQRARDAGVEVLEAPRDTAYGDRRATVRDRWGNLWQIATRRGD